MKKLARKAAVIMLASLLAISLTAGLSAAESKLVVQDSSSNNVFDVDTADSGVGGNVGFNMLTRPNYAVDVVSPGQASKSQLHFSLDGNDDGGWITSVNPNNFFISSGAVWDQAAGGWIQKSADGKSVFFGSGGVGFRAFVQTGNTPGQALSNLNKALHIDYDGNMRVGGGVQMNNGTVAAKPACDAASQGMLWMTKASTDSVQICASKSGSMNWYSISF